MSIFHNGKEYGATKIINYSAAPDYNKGISVTNIQDGNYRATDNGFLLIELQSQQSNVTKVSVIRSQNPITDNTGTEIASRVIQQFQYSETLTVQVMAREYYKLLIDGVGNPQIISCVFYPYSSTVPMKLTENIGVEQVDGLETADVRDIKYNIIDNTSPITDIKDLPYGWSIVLKENLINAPMTYGGFSVPIVHKRNLAGQVMFYWYLSYAGIIRLLNLYYSGSQEEDGTIEWDNSVSNIDLSISTIVSEAGTFSASQTVLMIENGVIKKVPKDSILPIGFIYIQHRGQSTPDVLFGTSGKWQDISSTYAGEFFRAVGGNSASFGSKQNEGLPTFNIVTDRAVQGQGKVLPKGEKLTSANKGLGGMASTQGYSVTSAVAIGTGNTSFSQSPFPYFVPNNSIYGASTHVTPYNSAIRIWKKIS